MSTIFMTGTRARDIAPIVELYGDKLVGISYEDENFENYTCLVLSADNTITYQTQVRVGIGTALEHERETVNVTS